MKEKDLSNYYNLLGLSKGASKDEIELAYQKIKEKYQKLLSSDAGFAAEKDKAKVDFEIITLAYQALIDDKARNAYDSLVPQSQDDWEEAISRVKQTIPVFERKHDKEGKKETSPPAKKGFRFSALVGSQSQPMSGSIDLRDGVNKKKRNKPSAKKLLKIFTKK